VFQKTMKKILTIIVILAVITSILMTAATADETGFNSPAMTVEPVVTDISALEDVWSAQIASEAPLNTDAPESTSAASIEAPLVPDHILGSTPVPEDAATETGVGDVIEAAVPESEPTPDLMVLAGQKIAAFSEQYDGFRYIYGAASPTRGFDCSGLVYYVYSHFGFVLPRTARAQYKNGTPVEQADLKPGDLVFFATGGGRSISHVGIYIADGQFIHASTSRHGVMISDLGSSYWSKAYVAACRLITPQTALQLITPPDGVQPI
jgi:cell wall-associated NlpC family hydrolase